MSALDGVTEGLKDLLETVKDLPTEKVAAVGLILLGLGSILKDLSNGDVNDAIDNAKDFIDSH